MRPASSPSSSPSSALTRAAVALMRPSQRMTGTGIGCPLTGKFATAFFVSPPQSSRRASVVLMQLNLALQGGARSGRPKAGFSRPARSPIVEAIAVSAVDQSRTQPAGVRRSAAPQAVRLRLESPNDLVAQAVALGPAASGSNQVAETQGGLLVAPASAVPELLGGG